MFRTKSLCGKEMKNLISSNKNNEMSKQNSDLSLRSLMADKTTMYHIHMAKLVQEPKDFLNASYQKENKSKTVCQVLKELANKKQGDEAKTKQFSPFEKQVCNEKEIINQEFKLSTISVPTYQDESILQEKSQITCNYPSIAQHISAKKSIFKVELQNEQLVDENKELRRQIQNLQQRLETTQLIRIQKQSQSQSLKLTVKILELKIGKLEQNIKEKQQSFLKFTKSSPISITIKNKQHSETSTQTILTCQKIRESFTINEEMKNKIDEINENMKELEQRYERKVSNLSNLLNLAQKEIKSLLSKLRDAKQAKIANFKEILSSRRSAQFQFAEEQRFLSQQQ